MIRREFTFDIDMEGLFQVLGSRFEKRARQERHQQSVERARADFHVLARPLLAWERMPVRGVTESQVEVDGGFTIGGGRFLEIIGGAEEVVAGVCTIGAKPEKHAREAMKGGDVVYGMVLDALANWAVDCLLNQFYFDFRDEVREKEGLRSSIVVSPGHAGWTTAGQREIFTAVEQNISGGELSITNSNMLDPLKSQSFIFGIGKNKLGRETGVICSLCELAGSCRYGKLKAEAWKR